MKGRTKCPNCKHEFVLDVSDDFKKHDVICPNCENKFTVKATPPKTESGEECFWEEHGEPRKTILSSKKPKTNKPKIAAIILICVFILGITTSFFSDTFIESSMDIASSIGLKGRVEISILSQNNDSIDNITVIIEDVDDIEKTGNGSYLAKNVEPGFRIIKISGLGYNDINQEILVTPFLTSTNSIKIEKGSKIKTKNYDTFGCTLIILILSVFALLGAISCLKRVHYDIAVAGSIISIFSFGFFMIGSILAIIAFVIIYKSKEEFENGKKGKIF